MDKQEKYFFSLVASYYKKSTKDTDMEKENLFFSSYTVNHTLMEKASLPRPLVMPLPRREVKAH